MREVDEELAEIKREIIESRGLVIKTNNLTNALSADIKSIAKRQQSYEQRFSWNGATAYIVFVLVVFTALKFAWDARVDSVTAETQQKSAENERLRKENRELEKREEATARAEAKAQAFYELVRQNKRVDVIEGYESVKNEPVTKTELAIFADAVRRARGPSSRGNSSCSARTRRASSGGRRRPPRSRTRCASRMTAPSPRRPSSASPRPTATSHGRRTPSPS